jgi:intracellular sulfur oxidation DsrE/DsrF family protein
MNDLRDDFSDERLNAFVDGQLGAQEREEILAAATANAELGRRLCELRATKELIRHAYQPAPVPARDVRRGLGGWGSALAASLALVVGLVAGWQGHRAASTPGPLLAGPAATQPARILIHLDSATEDRMEETLDMAEAYLAKVSHAKVEVVVNNSGLNLLREETTPYAERIAKLSSRHELLSFVACGYAISRYRNSGKSVTLLPEAQVAKTGVEHIVDRVREGWTYVKI